MSVFGEQYASAYDLIYQEKDYDGECALLEGLFRKYAHDIATVLDLGCGTGNHAIRLAKRGYEVTGVDASADMLRSAERKAAEAGKQVRLHHANLRELNLDRQFDAVLMMFAVLGYQAGNEDVLQALRAARRHTKTGGLFIFDVWYGPAVLAEKPGERFRVARNNGRTVLRTSAGTLDTLRHQCSVEFRLWQFGTAANGEEITERHLMRFFFPQEIALLLEITGFRLLRLGAFPEFDREPGERDWNVLAVAEAV
jgi:SAM-dependent methyltransferase